jgi:hypothetical protein
VVFSAFVFFLKKIIFLPIKTTFNQKNFLSIFYIKAYFVLILSSFYSHACLRLMRVMDGGAFASPRKLQEISKQKTFVLMAFRRSKL